MSFDINTIQDAFYNWVSTLIGFPVIWRFANAQRPDPPYMDLNITFITSIGIDYETTPDTNGNVISWGNRELTLELNYYGSGSLNAMEALYSSLRNDNILATLNKAGICYVQKMLQTNSTILLSGGSTYEERNTMELRFRYSNQGVTDPSKYNVGLISYIESVGTFDNEGQEIVKDVNVGTPYTPP
jgi:hypothetical protein